MFPNIAIQGEFQNTDLDIFSSLDAIFTYNNISYGYYFSLLKQFDQLTTIYEDMNKEIQEDITETSKRIQAIKSH